MEKVYNKLVRDRIPEIIKKDGETPFVRKLSVKEFKTEVLKKVLEEAKEFSEARNREELLKECADLQEILMVAMDAYKIDCRELNKVRNKRKKDRGGFAKRIFLIKTIRKESGI